MSDKLIIYGAGGAGRELAFALSLQNKVLLWDVLGFIDDTPELQGKVINDLPILGNYEWLKQHGGNIALCIVDKPKIKRKLVEKIKLISNIIFPTIISTDSIVSKFVKWGEGCIVSLPYNFISPNVEISDFVFINCTTRIGHDVKIGAYTTIFSGIDIGGFAEIGADCVIGSGSVINPHIKIGNGSIIGGGSVVVKDIPAGVVAAGCPAKVIRQIE